MKNLLRAALSTALLITCTQANAFHYPKPPGNFLFQIGGYTGNPGKKQHVDITGLIGNDFSVNKEYDTNTILGAGYIYNWRSNDWASLDFGINLLYFAKTQVSGEITQESLFTNLGYRYDISHIPIQVIAKAILQTGVKGSAITIDAGVGPNYMTLNNYKERSLDGGITVPDDLYTGTHTVMTTSAMAGVGIRFLVSQVPVEIGYRFFYLGEGDLDPRTTAVLDKLSTGQIYAHALVVTISS